MLEGTALAGVLLASQELSSTAASPVHGSPSLAAARCRQRQRPPVQPSNDVAVLMAAVLLQGFRSAEEVQRFSDMMEEMCYIVATKHSGSLKVRPCTSQVLSCLKILCCAAPSSCCLTLPTEFGLCMPLMQPWQTLLAVMLLPPVLHC